MTKQELANRLKVASYHVDDYAWDVSSDSVLQLVNEIEQSQGLRTMTIPKPKDRTNLDLLELVCQLHSRALQYPSKEMHDAYWEARRELEARLEQKELLQYETRTQ